MALKAVQQGPKLVEHGQHIFIYGHVRTNQIIYSLTRTLDNHASLKQLPFLGKQTQPSIIRKDMWRPLATVSFPSRPQGLSAYHKLREFRKRHELEWKEHDLRRFMSKKHRGRILQDQKANSVADLAAVLAKQAEVAEQSREVQETEDKKNEEAKVRTSVRLVELTRLKAEARRKHMVDGTPETRDEYKKYKREMMRLKSAMKLPVIPMAIAREYKPLEEGRAPASRESGRTNAPALTMDGVKIEWANIVDSELASTWPGSVIHDALKRGRGSRHAHGTSLEPRTAFIDSEAGKSGEASGSEKRQADGKGQRALDETEKLPRRRDWQAVTEQKSRLTSLVERLQFGKKPRA